MGRSPRAAPGVDLAPGEPLRAGRASRPIPSIPGLPMGNSFSRARLPGVSLGQVLACRGYFGICMGLHWGLGLGRSSIPSPPGKLSQAAFLFGRVAALSPSPVPGVFWVSGGRRWAGEEKGGPGRSRDSGLEKERQVGPKQGQGRDTDNKGSRLSHHH